MVPYVLSLLSLNGSAMDYAYTDDTDGDTDDDIDESNGDEAI